MTELEHAADAGGSAMADATGVPYETGAEMNAPTSLPEVEEQGAEETQTASAGETHPPEAGAEATPEAPPEKKTPEAAVHPHLAEAMEQHPALKQALASDTALRDKLGQAFARSAELEDFHAVFPTTEAARKAAGQAGTLASFDELYFNEAPEAPRQLLERLYDNQFLRDPETEDFLTDEGGHRISTGAYDRLTGAYRDILFAALEKQAAAAGDQDAARAVTLLQERIAGKAGSALPAAAKPPTEAQEQPKQPVGEPELPAGVKARLQRLDELERQQADQDQANWQSYYQSVAQAVEQAVRDDIQQAMGEAALPAYVRGKLVDDILEDLNRQAGSDASYQNRVQSLLRASNRSEAARQRIVAAARSQARARIAPVAQRHLNQAMKELRDEQDARAAKVREQQKRVEVKSSGSAPNPVRRSDSERIRGMEQKLGRRLSDREILDL